LGRFEIAGEADVAFGEPDFPLLQELLERTDRHPLLIIDAEDFVKSGDSRTATEELKNLLSGYI
jgi:hypothetical protein